MNAVKQKTFGAYYTPDSVVRSLVSWVVWSASDRMLDPSCGDGRFLVSHSNSVGVEQDREAANIVHQRMPGSLIHQGDFFTWAAETHERFDCAAGNPPFIRYQTFKGKMREHALALCSRLGTDFSGLSSSWAPFLVATASLLKPGGRMAFVVPAEIGHASYAIPLLEYFINNFATVHIVAVREKLFPELSEDCWLLYAEGFGAKTRQIRFTLSQSFSYAPEPPRRFMSITVREWKDTWNGRLRPFLIPASVRDLYVELAQYADTMRLGELASVGIGYVTGDNEFFHLRPSQADLWSIPKRFLHPSVRNSRALPSRKLSAATVKKWYQDDEQVLLLRIPKNAELPANVRRYLNTPEGKIAREAYKCRNRKPWFSVPDVQVPDFFLTYMSGLEPSLVRNNAGCTCTNSVHCVRIRERTSVHRLLSVWESPLVKLSCEIEGHPLGGGMLKLEPGEAARIIFPTARSVSHVDPRIVEDALAAMREWRHYVNS